MEKVKKLVTNTEIRKTTKMRALDMLKGGFMLMPELLGQLTQFNGWRIETNERLIRELSMVGMVVVKDGMISLPKSVTRKEAIQAATEAQINNLLGGELI